MTARCSLCLALAALALAGCGGGSGSGPPTGGGGNPPPATAIDFRDEIVYQLLTDRFYNGDAGNDGGNLSRRGDATDLTNPVGWHGGDLAGVRQKLESGYFQQLGFTAIWISPVVLQVAPPGNGGGVNSGKPFTGFHGYWAERFDTIEPHFGDAAALRALGAAADTAGIKLIVDAVVNHVGIGSGLVAQNPTWFRTGGQCGSDDLTLCLGGLPDFRQEVAGVNDFLLGTITFLRNTASIDGLRMDTMKHVPDAFWSQFFAGSSPASPAQLWTVGEVFSYDVQQVARYIDTVGSPSVFDFPLRGAIIDSLAKGGSTRRLADMFAQDTRYRDPTRLSTFLDNHDVWRFASEAEAAGIAPAEATQRLDMALSLLYTARGIPVVYYGTEIGMRGQGDSYNLPIGQSSREDMDFAGLAGSTLDERLRALADARKRYPALRRGLQRTLNAPTGASCQAPASALDPAADFGDRLYARGTFNGWSSPPPESQRFANLGGRQYEAAAEILAGRHQFKVAAADWTPEFALVGTDTLLGVPATLAAAPGAGNNSRIDMATAGCYAFALNAASTANPVLTITLKTAGVEPDVFAFARTLTGEKAVVVVLNNQRTDFDLVNLPGGGVDVQGLIADGAVTEITGLAHNLQVNGGRLRGTVPALSTLAVVVP